MLKKKEQELGKLQLTSGPRDPLDHVGAREWLEKVYRPLPKTPKPMHYVREPTTIRIHDVMVTYGRQEPAVSEDLSALLPFLRCTMYD